MKFVGSVRISVFASVVETRKKFYEYNIFWLVGIADRNKQKWKFFFFHPKKRKTTNSTFVYSNKGERKKNVPLYAMSDAMALQLREYLQHLAHSFDVVELDSLMKQQQYTNVKGSRNVRKKKSLSRLLNSSFQQNTTRSSKVVVSLIFDLFFSTWCLLGNRSSYRTLISTLTASFHPYEYVNTIHIGTVS